MKSVSVIIVNYNTYEHTIACIESLLLQKGIQLQIIVVDNHSQDESVKLLKQKFGDGIDLIANDANFGFGKANNIGAKFAQGSYIACVNPDIKLESPDTLSQLLRVLDSDNQLGLVAPKVAEPRKRRLIKPKMGYPQQHLLKHTYFLKDLPGKFAWFLGAFMLLPANVYREIAGFDEDFFLYGEDTDICLRVRKAGYKIDYVDTVTVLHWGGASEEKSEAYDKWLRKKRGYYQFCFKHYDKKDFLAIVKRRLWVCQPRKWLFELKYCFFRKHEYLMALEKINAEIHVIKDYQLKALGINNE
jgi:GT2 family glycosyltransferase